MYTALQSTSLTMAQVLRQHLKADVKLGEKFDSNQGGVLVVSLSSPKEMSENNLQGISLWLYRVEKDGDRLNESMERISHTQTRLRPLPLSLHYLITPVGSIDKISAETKQSILGKVLQTFHDHSILSGSDLQEDFVGTNVKLNIRLEPMSVDESTRVFDALEGSYQLSVSYQVSAVMIASDHEPVSSSPVQTAMPEYDVIVGNE